MIVTSTAAPGQLPNVIIRPLLFLVPLGVGMVFSVLILANGVLRERVLAAWRSKPDAHILSTIVLVGLVLAVSYGFLATTSTDYSPTEQVLIGVMWAVLAVGFQFLLGHFEQTPVEESLSQYNGFASRAWMLVPLSLLVATPLIGSWLRV